MRAVRACALAAILAVSAFSQTSQPASSRPTPRLRDPLPESRGALAAAKNGARLVVIVVVDQLATAVLDAAWPHLSDGGFRRIAREGIRFRNCAYLHACTETGPGHATIGTGATPAIHGIVGNDWIDAATRETLNCCDDRGTRLLSGSEPGSSAHRLLAPTIGDAMKLAFGSDARVASVSMKDRSAIFPVGAAADRVVWFDRKTGLFTTSTAFATTLTGPDVAWIDAMNRARSVLAIEEFTWDRSAPATAYADLGADDDAVEFPLWGSRTLPRTLRRDAARSLPEFCDWIAYSAAGLDLVFSHARFLATDMALGRDEVPDLLVVAPSSNDYVGHIFGPDSHEVRDMTLRTDRLLADLLTFLDGSAGRGRFNVLLTADHGIGPVPEVAVRRGVAAGRVDGDKLRRMIEAAMRASFGDPPPRETWVAKTLDADVLLNRTLLASKNISLLEAQRAAARGAAEHPGVADARSVLDILEGRLEATPINDLLRRSQRRGRDVDVYVLLKPHHLFGKTIASHGTPHLYDRAVPLFLSGPGFAAGRESGAKVAPGSGVVTLAAALGIAPPAAADHPVIEEALAQ